MRASISFGTYVHACSPVHSLDPRVKLALSVACVYAAYASSTWLALGLLAAAVACMLALARIPIRHALRGLAPLAFILACTVFFAAFSIGGTGDAVHMFLNVYFSFSGLFQGFRYALRIAVTVTAASLITFTSPPLELCESLTRLMRPFSRFGLPVCDIGLAISIVLRFIPLVSEEAYAIRDAQIARGAIFGRGGPYARLKSWASVLVPLVVRLFAHGDDLSRALESRCYTGRGQTQYPENKMSARDWAVLVIGCAAFISVGVFL